MHSNFGTNEEIAQAHSVQYGEETILYTEETLFNSNEHNIVKEKLSNVRKKLSDKAIPEKPAISEAVQNNIQSNMLGIYTSKNKIHTI